MHAPGRDSEPAFGQDAHRESRTPGRRMGDDNTGAFRTPPRTTYFRGPRTLAMHAHVPVCDEGDEHDDGHAGVDIAVMGMVPALRADQEHKRARHHRVCAGVGGYGLRM
jgi:hypothetical protein